MPSFICLDMESKMILARELCEVIVKFGFISHSRLIWYPSEMTIVK